MKIFRALYYYLFIMWQKKKNESGNAKFNTIISIAFLVYLNIMTLLSFIVFSSINLAGLPDINTNIKIVIAVFFIVICIFFYFLFAREKQHTKIFTEFDNVDKNIKRSQLTFTTIYIVLSIIFPFFVFYSYLIFMK